MNYFNKIIIVIMLMILSLHNAIAQDNVGDSTKQTVNIYIENSPSMDGYMVDGDFLKILGNLITDLETKFSAVNLYVISDPSSNSTITASNLFKIENKNQSVFSREFQALYSSIKVGRSGTSQLDKILKYIVNSTDSSNVSIFFSDMIFSDNKVNPQSILYDIFTKKKIDMLMYRFESNFHGTYYHEAQGYTSSSYHKQIDVKRPFFICVLSDDIRNLNYINKFESLRRKELQSSSILFTNTPHSFTEIKKEPNPDKNKQYNFTLKVKLDTLLLPQEYLTDTANYSVNGYKVKSIYKDSIANNKSSSYIIKLFTKTKPQEIILSLDKKRNRWIEEYSTSIDYPILNNLNKTYRLDDLMSGLYSAYRFKDVANESTSYAQIVVKIKQPDPPISLPVKILIWILVAVAVVVLVIVIKNKQY